VIRLSWSRLVRIRDGGGVVVAPSLLSADFSRLKDEIEAAERAGADLFHLDVMDGHFVPNLTFGPILVRAIRKLTALTLDTHLMIDEPRKYIEQFADAGSDTITIHIEASDDPRRDLQTIARKGKKRGITLNPDTPLSRVSDYFDEIDLLLVMSVFPGFAGQSFMPEVLTKIEEAKRIRERKGLAFMIEIDGGIGPDTSARAKSSGAEILVAGSAVFKSPDYARAIRAIRDAK
jgi:ribulose-phosphate 3-epimerase